MLDLEFSGSFDDDVLKMNRRGKDLSLMWNIIDKLRKREILEPRYRDHKLHGKMQDYRECHIERDWLLVYRVIKDKLVLYLSRTGTHDEVLK